MNRREFLVASALLTCSPLGAAQGRKQAKICMLSPVPADRSVWNIPLMQRLAEAGYRDGAKMKLEYRSSDGIAERLPQQARELIASKCDLIYALGPEAPARALQDARSPMPIVFLAIDYDPLEKGIVASLRQPDRNTTGIYVPQAALVAKRFEIMREVVPAARNFLVLVDGFSRDQLGPVRAAAGAASIRLTVIEFASPPYDLASAFESGRKAQVDGFIGSASPNFSQRRADIASLLMKHRLPGIGSNQTQAEAGYLLSLGPDVIKTTRRAAEMGIRILNGAKTSDIPVEQADEFELTVNAKTAKALGLKVPESVLARAVRIIQ